MTKKLKLSIGLITTYLLHKLTILKLIGLLWLDNFIAMELVSKWGLTIGTVLVSIALALLINHLYKGQR